MRPRPTARRSGVRIALCALLATLLLATAGTSAAPALSIAVSGNHLVSGGGKKVRLIGVNRSGSEYACAGKDGNGGHGYGIFQGPVSNRAIKAMKTWKVNAVALPLNEACWLGGYGGLKSQFTGSAYRNAIDGYVKRLNSKGIYVVLRLSGAGPGNHVYGTGGGGAESPMADLDHSFAFWQSVAAHFSDARGVLFHTYDEPHKISWSCLLEGCSVNANGSDGEPHFGTYDTAGQQDLVNAIRSQGATQPIILSGRDFAGDVSKWQSFMPFDPESSLVIGWNGFDYSGNLGSSKPDLRRLSNDFPVVVGGFGDTDCNSDFSNKLMRFADGQGISYLAWTWNTEADYGGCANALLGPKVSAYLTGHPSGYGRGVRKHYRKVPHH